MKCGIADTVRSNAFLLLFPHVRVDKKYRLRKQRGWESTRLGSSPPRDSFLYHPNGMAGNVTDIYLLDKRGF